MGVCGVWGDFLYLRCIGRFVCSPQVGQSHDRPLAGLTSTEELTRSKEIAVLSIVLHLPAGVLLCSHVPRLRPLVLLLRFLQNEDEYLSIGTGIPTEEN